MKSLERNVLKVTVRNFLSTIWTMQKYFQAWVYIKFDVDQTRAMQMNAGECRGFFIVFLAQLNCQ